MRVAAPVIAAALVWCAQAKASESSDFISVFERICVESTASESVLTEAVQKEGGWNSIPFPSDYRFDKADVNMAWSKDLAGRPFQILFSRISKRKSGGTICQLRTSKNEDAIIYLAPFERLLARHGFKMSEIRKPYIYLARGKGPTGSPADLNMQSALLVTRTDGTRPANIYLTLVHHY